MSASSIYDLAPIGSIVSWSDGTPRPPKRFHRKLAAWETRNSQGRLIRKDAPLISGTHAVHASFTLHQGNYGGGPCVCIKIHRTFSLASDLTFKVIAWPAAGSVRIFDRPGETRELLHLAEHRQAAEAWLAAHPYPNALLDEVTEDEAFDPPETAS
jgi:hypothetical protein